MIANPDNFAVSVWIKRPLWRIYDNENKAATFLTELGIEINYELKLNENKKVYL